MLREFRFFQDTLSIDLFTDSDAILKILSVDFCKFGFLVQNCVRIQIFTSITYRLFKFVISSQDYPGASEI